MAIIHYQFPIKSAHGRFEKDGMVFKKLNDTKFTCNFRKSSLPPTAAQLLARENFSKIGAQVADILKDDSQLEAIRVQFSEQSKYKSLKKFIWHVAGVQLGIYSD